MSKPTLQKITSWSFSRYSDYKSCPAKAKFKHIDKLKEPPNKAMLRGLAIHKMAEDFVKGAIRKVPEELKHFRDDIELLALWYKTTPERVMVEENWAFTNTWGKTEWNNWAECHLRVKLDAAFYNDRKRTMLTIVDWKTGRLNADKNTEYTEQMELYVLSAFKLLHNVDEVRPWLAYTDSGVTYPAEATVYTRAELGKLEKIWVHRTAPMLADTVFKPNPGNACTWCHFKKANGGPCQF